MKRKGGKNEGVRNNMRGRERMGDDEGEREFDEE